jgi:hypothetical protein
MTVGTVEAIADIGFGILLCIDDNFIAKPDLFTQLTAGNSFRGGWRIFYRYTACLLSHPRLPGLDPSPLA